MRRDTASAHIMRQSAPRLARAGHVPRAGRKVHYQHSIDRTQGAADVVPTITSEGLGVDDPAEHIHGWIELIRLFRLCVRECRSLRQQGFAAMDPGFMIYNTHHAPNNRGGGDSPRVAYKSAMKRRRVSRELVIALSPEVETYKIACDMKRIVTTLLV